MTFPAELHGLPELFEQHVETFRLARIAGPSPVAVHIGRQHCIEPYRDRRTMLCGHHVVTDKSQAAVGDPRERWCKTCVRIRAKGIR